ncbi:MAG TPA: hypothetical protein VGK87_15330 [Anaerolineae bacterium]|jgi:hypothetical protein
MPQPDKGNADDGPTDETVVETGICSIDLDELSQRIYQLLMKELVLENERTGRRY